MNKKQVRALAQRENMDAESFISSYLYDSKDCHIGISEASYSHTEHSIPPEDGKLRKIKPAYNWLKLREEILHPKISALEARPINYAWVYTNI